MAEVGTVIAIVQIADRVIELCKYWIETVRDAPSDLRSILLETSMLRTIFESIEFFIKCNDALSTAVENLLQPNGALHHCRELLVQLESLLPPGLDLTPHSYRSTRERMTRLLTHLAWPLKQTKAQKLLQELGRHKAAISLALTTQSTQYIQEIKANNLQMLNMLSDNQRHEFYRWLERTDPSPLHNRARQQIEDRTCEWMLRSSEWNDWLAAQSRCLWIHGIPGAGKTILASYLIEKLKDHCANNRSNLAFAYYYCYFGHSQDEAAPFLRWIITQLCRQAKAIPSDTYNLFERGCEPSLPELLGCLSSSLGSFDTVYIVIDAVDESSPRDDLLKVVRDLASDSRFNKIQLLTTSREYIDIERVLEGIFKPVSMSNPFIAEDIRRYVQVSLQSNPKFKRWPQQLLTEVERALSLGATGMFRWVACQLEILERLRGDTHAVRHALANLPKTLDETYERIFLKIVEEEIPLVRQCLTWIDFHNNVHGGAIPCGVLLRALDNATEPYSNQRIRMDEESLKEICGCLIQISEGEAFGCSDVVTQTVSLAHYTVREFLVSTRMSKIVAGYFALDRSRFESESLTQLCRTALNFSPQIEYCEDSGGQGIRDYCYKQLTGSFQAYCAVTAIFILSSEDLRDEVFDQPNLRESMLRLLSPLNNHIQPILSFIRLCGCSLTDFSTDFESTTEFHFCTLEWYTEPSSSSADAMIFFESIVLTGPSSTFTRHLAQKAGCFGELVQIPLKLEMWVDDEDVCFDGSIVEIFAQLNGVVGPSYLNFILDQIESLSSPDTVLHYFLATPKVFELGRYEDEPHAYIIDRILELGANPNGCGYTTTPLQNAIASFDHTTVKLLLHAGAVPTKVGDPNGIRSIGLFGDYLDVEGMTPLDICRSRASQARILEEEDCKMIEDALIRSSMTVSNLLTS